MKYILNVLPIDEIDSKIFWIELNVTPGIILCMRPANGVTM